MRHMVRIDGVNKAIKKGLVMIDGVVKEIKRGMVVIDGDRKDIRLSDVVSRTATLKGATYLSVFVTECFKIAGYNRGAGAEQTFLLKEGSTVTASCGLSKDYLNAKHSDASFVQSQINYNGQPVAVGNGTVEYTFIIKKDIEITCRYAPVILGPVYVYMDIQEL